MVMILVGISCLTIFVTFSVSLGVLAALGVPMTEEQMLRSGRQQGDFRQGGQDEFRGQEQQGVQQDFRGRGRPEEQQLGGGGFAGRPPRPGPPPTTTEAPRTTTQEDTSGRLLSLPVAEKCANSKNNKHRYSVLRI